MADFDFGLGDVIAGLDPTSGLDMVADAGAAAAGPAGSGADWGSMFKDVGGVAKDIGSGVAGAAKGALPFVQAGTGVAGIMAGIKGAQTAADLAKTQKQALQTQTTSGQQAQALAPQAIAGSAEPLSTFGKGALAKAEKGQISDASRALIDNWKAGAVQQAKAYYEHIGQGDSDTLRMALSLIERQAKAMEQSALEQEQGLGISALTGAGGAYGTAGGILTGGGNTAGGAAATAGQQQQQLQNLIANANQWLAKVTAGAG